MVFCGHPRRWLILLGCGRASSLSPSIARLQQSLFIIFVSMEDSYLIGIFGSIRLLRRLNWDDNWNFWSRSFLLRRDTILQYLIRIGYSIYFT